MADRKKRDEAENLARFRDTALSFEERARALAACMTLEEKASQLAYDAPAIERLGVPAYNWCNEALHGVAHAGVATVFPQAIGLAATWNPGLIQRVAAAISDEARAKHHAFVARGDRSIHTGLNFWSPNINIYRDPRWGRGQETYGEDPWLTGRMGVAFVRGMQGDHPKYLKTGATVKHFAAHSGPEAGRRGFDAKVSAKDLHETYLPAFRACVEEAGVHAVMGAYNRLNGSPCCANAALLGDILRKAWGFDGYVVSDCGAIESIWKHHEAAAGPAEGSALAVRNGCDLDCGSMSSFVVAAVERGLLSEAEVDTSLVRVMTARLRFGEFDPPEQVPYAHIPAGVVDSDEHRNLAREAARQSVVLLKNAGGVLPLARERLKNVLIAGPNGASVEALLGNYNGLSRRMVTPMEGILGKLGPAVAAKWKPGCTLTGEEEGGFFYATIGAGGADVIIAVLGLGQSVEGEEGVAFLAPTGGDRTSLALPGRQLELLKRLRAYNRPLVLVVASGGPVDLSWAAEHADAIVQMWYPGEEGGNAVADVLFGDSNPAGRLSVTFVRSEDGLPPMEDYSMAGRTYRYLKDEPLYPFGYGLSYTTFAYGEPALERATLGTAEDLRVAVPVKNTGGRAGDEVVQLYVSASAVDPAGPRWSLKAFERVSLAAGEERVVRLTVASKHLAVVDGKGASRVRPGRYVLCVGGQQPDSRSAELLGRRPREAAFTIAGESRLV